MVVDHQVTGMSRLPDASASSAARILVVDDEETVMLTIQGILELDGYDVVATTEGQTALELLRAQHFDLVLTDLRLENGIDGIDVLRELRRQSVDAVSIMLTGYASLDSAVNALREGAYDYLVKPCDVLELRTAVTRGLERSRLAAEVRQRVEELEQANETIRALNLELEARVERATADLREEVQAKDEFMATVSHDLKSPLTFIKGIANLRRRRAAATPETAPLVDALNQIETSAGRMAQQLDEIVDASRLNAGRSLELRREPTDLVGLAQKAVAEHQATSDRHLLHVQANALSVVGLWDPLRVARVLDNLLDNAIKFSPRGGTITVAIEARDNEAEVRVSDRGEGIPAADLPHVFERFRRGANVEGRIPGTGIGLNGVQRIVELHQGTISVISEVGVGSTFTVRIPLRA
jgi:signal transduction histidine kinase